MLAMMLDVKQVESVSGMSQADEELRDLLRSAAELLPSDRGPKA